MVRDDEVPATGSTKKPILARLWADVKARGAPWTFDNEGDVKHAIAEHKKSTGVAWRNYADLTKVDFKDDLPDQMIADDVFIVHLGGGKHQFIKGIDLSYHRLEAVSPADQHVEAYTRSLWDAMEGGKHSEAGDLSRIFNLRIFHRFLYDNPGKEVRIHLPGRKKYREPLDYLIGPTPIRTNDLQIEMDFMAESESANAPLEICIAEAKSTRDTTFNISQLYIPYRFILERVKRANFVANVRSLFVQTTSVRFRALDAPGVPVGWHRVARLFEYKFGSPGDLASLEYVKSSEYVLVER